MDYGRKHGRAGVLGHNLRTGSPVTGAYGTKARKFVQSSKLPIGYF
ncbi:MAG TPA: hypothetical protein VJX93_03365 [Candidatus Methanomethylophilaceae archaeon]|nr:hypothetical protein [Candidatus Methanomethylophilaceae archaeon]